MSKKISRTEALTEALFLALSAPTDEQAARAAELGEQLAVGLTEIEVARAKADAIGLYEDTAR